MQKLALALFLGTMALAGCGMSQESSGAAPLPDTSSGDTSPWWPPPAPATSTTSSSTETTAGNVHTAGDLQVTIDNDNSAVAATVVNGMLAEYFEVYPTMMLRFNSEAPTHVTFDFDPTYDGVAETTYQNATIRLSASYFQQNPNDIDVVTHESFHLIQSYSAYGEDGCPGWATEGMADYARWRYGKLNTSWELPSSVASTDSYTAGYTTTARFFVWVENQVHASIVADLFKVLGAATYTDDFWMTETGISLDDLWSRYSGVADVLTVQGGNCTSGQLYCGGHQIFGASDVLYICQNGSATTQQKCTNGCTINDSGNDACAD